MKRILQLIPLAGLLLTILPPILFFLGRISHTLQNGLMLLGAIVWFASAIFGLGSKPKPGQ
ncbi:hypothetical protein [Mariniphaga sediminis]|uniref:hypothetical protein n=1 Tax=Mariniphaga sediminis TaxID=1628158 RepID=UPI003567AEB1